MNTRRSFLASLAKLAGFAVAAPAALRKLADAPASINPMAEVRSIVVRGHAAGLSSQSYVPGMVKCLDVGEEIQLVKGRSIGHSEMQIEWYCDGENWHHARMHPHLKSLLVSFGCSPTASDHDAQLYYDAMPVGRKCELDQLVVERIESDISDRIDRSAV